MRVDKKVVEFDWDKGNIGKNKKHKVEDKEAEEVFFDDSKVIYKDVLHSAVEERYVILGKTKEGRLLYTIFTKRGKKFRIISSRNMNRNEKNLYEKET